MNTAIKTSWKTMSLLPMTANLLLFACGNEPLAVNGTVTGALSAEDVMEVAVVWKGASGDIAAVEFHPVDQLDGDFHLPLPATPPPEVLQQIGGTTGAFAGVVLTKNRQLHAQSTQGIMFLSGDLGDVGEHSPDSPLHDLTAGYNLLLPSADGEAEVIPFDSTIEIDVNSPDNCNFRLYDEMAQCEEQEGPEAGCWAAHQERVETCVAGG